MQPVGSLPRFRELRGRESAAVPAALLIAAVMFGLLLIAANVYAAIAPGKIELSRIDSNQRIQWQTTGTTAIVHGDDAILEVTYDTTTHRWYCALFADEETAATDGKIPPLKMTWGGASNQIWLEARRPKEVN